MAIQFSPKYRPRFSFDEILSTYATPEDAWGAGDFVLVSEVAPEGSELRACAAIMCGFIVQGLELLKRIETLTPRGALIRAFALWQLDRSSEARSTIDQVPPDCRESEMATRLLRLIDAREIRVITNAVVLPLFTGEDATARQPVRRYGQFKMSCYATQLSENAWPNELADPIDVFIEGLESHERPDFIFSQTPQWTPPTNFTRINVPRVLWCHDTDVFFNRAADNLAIHDVRLTCTSQEHFELRHALGRPCISSILTEPMCMPGPKPNLRAEKDIDVLFTGAALNVFHSEKPRFLYQLASLSPKYRIHIVDGHVTESAYFDLVARARFVPIVNRYSGQPSPRWLDALAHSSCVLYPYGAGYANVGAGCFAYRDSDIAADISRHIEAHRVATPGSPYHPATVYENTARNFSHRQRSRENNMEKLLKFAAFSALVWPGPTPSAGGGTSLRQRSIWYTPPIDQIMFKNDRIGEKVERYADSLQPNMGWDDRDYNNAAALSMHLAALFGDTLSGLRLRRAYALLDEGLARFPNSLLLRFNAAHWRALEGDRAEADSRFIQLIKEFDRLDYSPRDSDVGLPVTFYQKDQIFPYYNYCQLVLSAEVRRSASIPGEGGDIPCKPADVLLAAAHGFLGLSAERRGDLDRALGCYRTALAIYPDSLPIMRMRLAALCRLGQVSSPDVRRGDEIMKALVDCISMDPAVLVSSAHQVVTTLDRLNCRDAIREVLAMWYRLASVTSSGSSTWFADAIDGFAVLSKFEALFPAELGARLAQLRTVQGEMESASQFETLILAGAKIKAPASTRLVGRRALWSAIRRNLRDGVSRPARIIRAIVRRMIRR